MATANDRYKKFEVQHQSEAGDEWMEVEATDHEDAALVYAHGYDTCGEYTLMKGGTEQIAVRRKGEENVQWYEISGEAVPQYYARTMDALEEATSDHPPPGSRL